MDKGTSIRKIPLILITGFLGSGKTSLLKQILRKTGSETRIAIIQNEFAPGRVDSVELESLGTPFDLLEINNGSVFCACLLDDFIKRLGDFINTHQPDAIFLEATGLADPVSLAQILQSKEVEDKIYLGGIWVVVDSANFTKSHKYVQRVRHQIQIADIILLNKSDLKFPGEELKNQILEWNPYGQQYIAENGLFEDLVNVINRDLNEQEGIRTFNLINTEDDNSLDRPDIGSCVIRSQKTFSERSIKAFHNKNRSNIFRMKGYVKNRDGGYLLIQSIFDQLNITYSDDWSGPTEIIFMGPGIRPGPLTREFINIAENG